MSVQRYRTLTEAMDEVERELNVRARCFPGWVDSGRVSRTDAHDRMDRMATAFRFLKALADADEADTVAAVEAEAAKEMAADQPQTPAAKPF